MRVGREQPIAVASQHAFFGVASLLFAVCAALTVLSCVSMPGALQLCSGASMPAAWMRLPGQSWLGAASCFLVMWDVMMVAMMLPALLPSLWRRGQVDASTLTLRLAGYFLVWSLV